MALTPLLTATPNDPPTYSVGQAETFSWVPVQGADRPMYARATYLTNASDISVSLSSAEINMNMADVENLVRQVVTKIDSLTASQRSVLGQNGFDFITGSQTANNGPYSTVQVVSAAKIFAISATNTNARTLTAFELPVNFSFNGPIHSITLGYGAAIVYKL